MFMELGTKFSVTIPAYKRTYLKETIDSCLSQTYQNFELVIVNDASPEDLDSIVSSYSDKRIRYYKNEKNCGAVNVVDNWNKCLEYANGDYIICMGDDDRLLPNCLQEYVNLISENPGLGVYHAWTEVIDENGNFFNMQSPRPKYEGAFSLCWNRWNGRRLQFIGDFCFETKRLKDDGGFYKLPMAWASDDISAVRAARFNGIANTQEVCFQYRVNRQSITRTGSFLIKMEATLGEKEWYENFVRTVQPINVIEEKYKELISEYLDLHFRDKFKNQMSADMKSNPFNVIHWIKNRKKFGLSLIRVLEALFLAQKRR